MLHSSSVSKAKIALNRVGFKFSTATLPIPDVSMYYYHRTRTELFYHTNTQEQIGYCYHVVVHKDNAALKSIRRGIVAKVFLSHNGTLVAQYPLSGIEVQTDTHGAEGFLGSG